MARRIFLPVTLVAGVGLILLGLAWKQLYPPESYWSEEQARQLVDAFAELHNLQHSEETEAAEHGGTSFEKAKEKYHSLKGELESARTAHDRTGSYLAAAGAALIAVGILIYVKVPPSEPDDRDSATLSGR